MLSRITISNLVIVRDLDLPFERGMSALTGETGAGKSILIDALGLALGDKADNNMIRAGADRAEISVAFELTRDSQPAQWLERHDLAADAECLLRRVLVRDGRSRAYINGVPSPVALLRELGEMLIDIHGQNAHQ
ncbi:MAG: AAA family ATPase [Sedimenticolaceae bacterium]